jgi:fructose-1,6-bisphosphatase/inositol monophosphatase family enzyme
MLVNGVPNDGYQVTLADLIDIADAACHLADYQNMLVDKPAEQAAVRMYETKLHDIAQRASGNADVVIYGKKDGSTALDYAAIKTFYFAKGAAEGFESAFFRSVLMAFERGMKVGART